MTGHAGGYVPLALIEDLLAIVDDCSGETGILHRMSNRNEGK
jgi:hypothetical protein